MQSCRLGSSGGRSIRISARGDGAYPLGGTPQGGVGIIIDVGGVRFCGFFGGTIVKDDGERFWRGRLPPPAAHPGDDDHDEHHLDHDDHHASTTSTSTTTTTSTPPTTIIAVGFSENS